MKGPEQHKLDCFYRAIENSRFGKDCVVWYFVNIFNADVGNNVSIGAFTEIQNAKIGNGSRIGAQCFIPDKIEIGEDCFIGPGTCFTNDKNPSVEKVRKGNFRPLKTIIDDRVNIGANCTILPGILIGKDSVIGAGTVVTKDVPPNTMVYGDKRKQI